MRHEYDEELFEALLKIALEKQEQIESEEIPSLEKLDEIDIETSEMDIKVHRLMYASRRRKKRIGLLSKILISAITVLIVSSGVALSISATRNQIVKFIFGETDVIITVETMMPSNSEYENVKEVLPAYIPEGFVLTEKITTELQVRLTYESENETVYLKIMDMGTGTMAIDISRHEVIRNTLANKLGTFFITTEKGGENIVTGITLEEEKEFVIFSTLPITELEKIANSIS